MESIGIQEAAKRWGVSPRLVQRYCALGRIAGAEKQGGAWLLPARAEKPQDPRGKLPQPLDGVLMQGVECAPGGLREAILRMPSAARRAQGLGEYCYYTGRFQEALQYFSEAESDPAMLVTALTMEAVTHISLGDYASFHAVEERLGVLEGTFQGQKASMRMMDLCRAIIAVSLYSPDRCPKWITECDMWELPASSRLFAAYIYVKYLHSRGRTEEMLGAASGALMIKERDRFSAAEIYLCIMCAVGCEKLERPTEAERYLTQALKLSRPEGFTTPFAEHFSALGNLTERCIKAQEPKFYAAVSAQWKQTYVNWTAVHNGVARTDVSLLLSLREYQAALLAYEGCSNREIAGRMNLSQNSVKNYLKSVFQKLYITRRSELKHFFG